MSGKSTHSLSQKATLFRGRASPELDHKMLEDVNPPEVGGPVREDLVTYWLDPSCYHMIMESSETPSSGPSVTPDMMEWKKEEGGAAGGPSRADLVTYCLDHNYNIPSFFRPLFTPDVMDKEKEKWESDKVADVVDAVSVLPLIRRSKPAFKLRSQKEDLDIKYEFLRKGIDIEDIGYIKRSYEMMLSKNPWNSWLNRTRWVEHPPTLTPDPKVKDGERIHDVTGSARTEGFYKLDLAEKKKQKLHLSTATTMNTASTGTRLFQDIPAGKTHLQSRETRSNQRRLLTALGNIQFFESDLKFNQLKLQKKNLRFARSSSSIHDWGIFAAEPIGANEMVIEYVGERIRPIIGDVRKRKYQVVGIENSNFFRIDSENIIDGTRRGNLSRFINHSSSPNCYTKIITVQGQRKIGIYLKQQIAVNEEITFDREFSQVPSVTSVL